VKFSTLYKQHARHPESGRPIPIRKTMTDNTPAHTIHEAPTISKSTTPLLIFVLGPPCAGKSTICKLLAARYDLDHFSLGDKLPSLVSANPTGPPARIKSKFTAAELEVFTQNVMRGTLGPANQTPKYVKERIFREDIDVKADDVRILVDGFPRGVDRWWTFKESVKDRWQPDRRTWAIVLDVDKDVARERYFQRKRAGDVFEKRFDDHMESIRPIVAAMRDDNVRVVITDGNCNPNTILKLLNGVPKWAMEFGRDYGLLAMEM
jgi:UMP-CMP kinase